MNKFDKTISHLLKEQDTNDSNINNFDFLKKNFSNLPPYLQKTLRIIYGKIYENKSNYDDSIFINDTIAGYYYNKASGIDQPEYNFSETYSRVIKNNLPVYFLSEDFCKKALDAKIDQNILFEDLTLPFDSYFYMIPKNISIAGKHIQAISVSLLDDIICRFYHVDAVYNFSIRDVLTKPNITQKDIKAFDIDDENQYRSFTNEYIEFITAILLFHQTGGFDKQTIPLTPLPDIKGPTGKPTLAVRKRVSANVIDAPQISYEKRKPTDEEINSFSKFHKGYYQTRTHIRIRKNKKTGEIKIIGVSSSQANPHKKPESVEFKKRKLSEQEINELVKTNKEYIIKKLQSLGYSEDEIKDTLKKYNLI